MSSMAKVSLKRRSAKRWRRTTSRAQIGHARENPGGGFVGDDRKAPGRAGGVQAGHLRGLAFFATDPDLLEKMIEADFVVGGNASTAIGGGNGQRAIDGMLALHRGVEVQAAVG